MLRRLIDRPVAVTMTLVAILIVGVVSIGRLPVSLMPSIDVPRITVEASLPGASAREVDLSVVQPLRRELLQLPSLEDIRCEAGSGSATLVLTFSHGSDAGFNYVETGERIDRAMSYLPAGMERPTVIRASATDIPAFFLDISSGDVSEERFIELSRFVREVLVRRVEQIPEVAMVDVSGLLGSSVLVEPDDNSLAALGIGPEALESAIRGANLSLGNLTIRDGHYQWNVRFDAELRSASDIADVRLGIGGRVYRLGDLATVRLAPAEATGLVRSGGERAVTLAVIKQADAQMASLRRHLSAQLRQFRSDYPELKLSVTRNQTELLDYSMSNLRTNILVGAVLAVLVLLLFMRQWRAPLLVALTIPLSLVSSLLLLYLIGVGINIISLSGLILGIGMMVDNSIIVIDNITQWRQRGVSLKEAAVGATREVVAPMVSSVLTTCSVFVPLIFLSGTAGALFYDQAMAVVVTLVTSLAVSVFVLPVYYVLLYRRRPAGGERTERSGREAAYVRWYESALRWVLRHQRASWCLFLGMLACGLVLLLVLDKRTFPPLTHDDALLDITWNTPLTLSENDARASALLADLPSDLSGALEEWSLLAGRQDFILGHSGDLASDGARLYFKAKSPRLRAALEEELSDRLAQRWPEAVYAFSEAANPFNLVFTGDGPTLVAMLRGRDGSMPEPDRLNALIARIRAARPDLRLEPVSWQEQIVLEADPEKLALYGVSYDQVYASLSRATHERTLLTIRSGSSSVPVFVTGGPQAGRRTADLLSLQVPGRDSTTVPLSYVLEEHRSRDLSRVISGREGHYYPLGIEADGKQVAGIRDAVTQVVRQDGDFDVSYGGGWYRSRAMIRELALVLLVSLLLLFFILAAQFESLVQPLIILSEVAVDIFGALFALWIAGSSINLMSLIGIVVMAGIVINDSILKVDTINRLRRAGRPLLRAIVEGGSRRLRPILMTSLTTIGAIAPFLVRGTMGADLQFPLSVALIGGMIVGTLVSLLFVPLFYYEIYRRKDAAAGL